MSNFQVTAALVEALIFLELSDDEMVDPDSAVRTMEMIADLLHKMTPDEREAFIRQLGTIADAQPATEFGAQRSEYIRAIPGYLGLADG